MLLVFVPAIFIGAMLLFLVQPLAARLILPELGGSPAVWNSCLVVYQALLLGGYAYAHAIARLAPKVQVGIHLVVIAAAAFTLPITLPDGLTPPETATPVFWVLGLLLMMVGAPFFVVSTASPLLQSWFSRTGHKHAKDPYFLYAASNAGSLLGLLAYPLLLEPSLTLRMQGMVWAIGFGGFGLLVAVAGLAMVSRAGRVASEESVEHAEAAPDTPVQPIGLRRTLYWIILAAIPSSLMLGVTHHITTDIAAVPFLWVLPLGLYLLTFIITFSSVRLPTNELFGWLFRIAAIIAMSFPLLKFMGLFGLQNSSPRIAVIVHLCVLIFAAMFFHRKLAQDRPDVRHLTRFYLLVSLGGVIGGAFNALAAPFLFDWIAEYPIVLLVACFFTVSKPSESIRGTTRVLIRGASTVASLVLIVEILFSGALQHAGSVIFKERTFFGVLRVNESPLTNGPDAPKIRLFSHGTTLHGLQITSAPQRYEAISYYSELGGIGRFWYAFKGLPVLDDVAIVGLGVGMLAARGEPDERFTFYEIDPAVAEVASDPELFTYLSDSPSQVDIVIGDARRKIAEAEDGRFGMIMLDAFSSDAIPVHLLTKEAFELYLQKLAPGGVIVVHVSNRYLDLAATVAATANAVDLMAFRHLGFEGEPSFEDVPPLDMLGYNATFLFVVREPQHLAPFNDAGDKLAIPTFDEEKDVWTDDFSNLWRTIRFFK